MHFPAFVCLSVCQQDYSKMRACIWMKCCMSTDVGTWMNWLTVEPDPYYSPDAGKAELDCFFLRYHVSHATRNFTSGKSDVYILVAAVRRGFKMVLRPTAAAMLGFTKVSFTETVSCRNTFVGGTCTLPSALLVWKWDHTCMCVYGFTALVWVYAWPQDMQGLHLCGCCRPASGHTVEA